MPLNMLEYGRNAVIKRFCGRDNTARFLEGLGLTPGTEVSVVCENGGDLILQVKNSRVALGRGLASRVIVEAC